MTIDTSELTSRGYDIEFVSHAEAIIENDFPNAWEELKAGLLDFAIPMSEIVSGGGGESAGTQRLRRSLAAKQWEKVNFTIRKTINGVERESISHEVDHVREFDKHQNVALEIEWNNKDPFFDRDLENFKRLHAEGAISVGMIVTRGSSLQRQFSRFVSDFVDRHDIRSFADLEGYGYIPTKPQKTQIEKWQNRDDEPMTFRQAFTKKFVSDKFGTATTHWNKLQDRVSRGVGNPCPLLLIGLPASILLED